MPAVERGQGQRKEVRYRKLKRERREAVLSRDREWRQNISEERCGLRSKRGCGVGEQRKTSVFCLRD